MPDDRDYGYKGGKGYKDEGSYSKGYDKDDSGSKWYHKGSHDKKHSHNESDQQRNRAKYGFVDESLRGGSGSQACK